MHADKRTTAASVEADNSMSTKRSIRKRLEDFISSDRGQRFFNFAYSIGAAIVILGALFMILHMPGGGTLLTIGMGTEVIMFLLAAFDRPSAQNAGTDGNRTHCATDAPRIATTCVDNAELNEAMQGVMSEMARLKEITAALNTVGELQLKNATSQLGSIESSNHDMAAMNRLLNDVTEQSRRYCDETMKMTENMARLNSIYERMIAAMSSGDSNTSNK